MLTLPHKNVFNSWHFTSYRYVPLMNILFSFKAFVSIYLALNTLKIYLTFPGGKEILGRTSKEVSWTSAWWQRKTEKDGQWAARAEKQSKCWKMCYQEWAPFMSYDSRLKALLLGDDIQIDPIAFMFILGFAVSVVIQFLAMLYHRWPLTSNHSVLILTKRI